MTTTPVLFPAFEAGNTMHSTNCLFKPSCIMSYVLVKTKRVTPVIIFVAGNLLQSTLNLLREKGIIFLTFISLSVNAG